MRWMSRCSPDAKKNDRCKTENNMVPQHNNNRAHGYGNRGKSTTMMAFKAQGFGVDLARIMLA